MSRRDTAGGRVGGAVSLAMAVAGEGRVDEALALLDGAIGIAPGRADLHHARGRVRLLRGDTIPGIEDLRTTVQLAPEYLEGWRDLYRSLHAVGMYPAAIQCAAVARRLAAGEVDVTIDEGAIRLASGDLEGAHALAEEALRVAPTHPGALNLKGAVAINTGDLEAAEAALSAAVSVDPSSADAWLNLGRLALDRQDAATAAMRFERACEVAPRSAAAHQGLGAALRALGRFPEAIGAFDMARVLAPGAADLLNDLGGCRLEAGDLEGALADLDAALAAAPDHADALANRAQVLVALGRRDEARASAEAALARAPNQAAVHAAMGVVHRADNRVNAAIASFGRALELRPGYRLAEMGRGMMRLLEGDLPAGLRDYEARLRDHPAFAPLHSWQWRGEPLAGKSITLVAEQGIGDAVQFIRYAPLLAARGATVHAQVHPGLVPMARRMPSIAQVFVEGDALPRTDFYAPMLSVPLYCGTDVGTIPAEVPYITPDPARAARWRGILRPGPFRVGVAWSGNPRHYNDRQRSMTLETLAPLLALPGVEFVGLQKDVPPRDLAIAPGEGIALGASMDIEDVIAVVTQLDLVISIDTSIAHIAGALGRPTWLMLSYAHDWRWLRGRVDSPWYPRMRIFRQGPSRDWGEVVAAVAASLAERRR